MQQLRNQLEAEGIEPIGILLQASDNTYQVKVPDTMEQP